MARKVYGTWVMVFTNLTSHPKFLELRKDLALEERDTVGLLVTLWSWTMEHRSRGVLTRCGPKHIASAVKWKGNPEKLVASLERVGWLDRVKGHDDPPLWRVHDWHDFAGVLLDRRKRDAERKRRQRDKLRGESPQDVTRTSDGHPGDVRGSHGVTGQDRTGPDRTGPDLPKSESEVDKVGGADPTLHIFVEAFVEAHPTFRTDRPFVVKHLRRLLGCGLPDPEVEAECRSPRHVKPWDVVDAVAARIRGTALEKAWKGARA